MEDRLRDVSTFAVSFAPVGNVGFWVLVGCSRPFLAAGRTRARNNKKYGPDAKDIFIVIMHCGFIIFPMRVSSLSLKKCISSVGKLLKSRVDFEKSRCLFAFRNVCFLCSNIFLCINFY